MTTLPVPHRKPGEVHETEEELREFLPITSVISEKHETAFYKLRSMNC